MKKIVISGFLLTLLAFSGQAQSIPDCSNNNGLEGRINGIEAQGWQEISREFVYINYFAEPTPPYQIGTLRVAFQPACDPNEPCPKILMLYMEDATQQTQNTCIWTPTHL